MSAPKPYDKQAPRAQYIKAIAQMIIGASAAIITLILAVDLAWKGHTGANIQQHVFTTIGVALAVGAGIELAYTLFTHGPDEALDPLMLGLSAAIVLQLAKADQFDLKQASSAIIYVAALGGAFAIRKYLAEEIEVGDPEWPDLKELLRDRRRKRKAHREAPKPPDNG